MGTEKLILRFDFRKVQIPEKFLELPVKKSDIEQELFELAERFLTIGDAADGVRVGDVIRIDLAGEPLYVNVGKGYYDPQWENTLVGKRAGASVTLPKRGRGQTGTIAAVRRRNIPALTDGMVVQAGIPGVATVEDYRRSVEERFVRAAKRSKEELLLEYVLKETVKASTFGCLTEELARRLVENDEDLHRQAERFGMSYEEVLAHQTRGARTPEEVERRLRDKAELDVKRDLLIQSHVEEDGVTFGREDFEAYQQIWLDRGMTAEQVEANFSYEDYLKGAPISYFYEKVQAYLEPLYRVVKK